MRETGTYTRSTVAGEDIAAFVPHPLPPDPPLGSDVLNHPQLHTADEALVRLDLAGDMVPSLDWFLYAFVRKEAVLSSQIEGTQATLVDVLSHEGQEATDDDEPATPDVEEVCNYVEAIAYARAQLADPAGLPLSMRLLNETHRRLMQGTRGADKRPGEIRRSQNWIGGTRPGNAAYVPPPPDRLPDLLAQFESYLHSSNGLPPLIRAGLIHVQFEAIHPYLDGNGRIGRLLISLLLEEWKLLREPLLYLSLHFKRHQAEYYRRLNAVRTDGDWEGWMLYFLEGVAGIAEEAVQSIRELFARVTDDRSRVLAAGGSSLVAARLFELLPRHPIITTAFVTGRLETTKPTAGRALDTLVDAGVLVETTGRKRDRAWAYQRYVEVLREGTDEPLRV